MSHITQKQYPRAIPFSPPLDLAAREIRLRRLTSGLMAAIALLLVVLVAVGVILAKVLSRPGERGRRTPAVKTTDAAGTNLPQRGPDAPVADGKSQPPSRAELAAKTRQALHLQTIAVLTVDHLEQSYLILNLLANGRQKKVYTQADAANLLANVAKNLDLVDSKLAHLQASGLDSEFDKKDVARVRKTNALLRVQARALKAYWEDPDRTQAADYETARAAAWENIKPLLGIDTP